jgi:predicted nucleic acid-binding Zn ribbon protein
MNNQAEKKEPVHIKSIISDVLKKYRNEKSTNLFQIIEIWESAVGAAIANDTRPWKIKGNELEVQVSSPSWLQQLSYMKNDIIQKLNDNLGEKVIQSIRFSVAHIPNQNRN